MNMIGMTDDAASQQARELTSEDRLDRLTRTLGRLRHMPLVRVGGRIIEASQSYCRVEGLGKYLRLDDCVEIETKDRLITGQVVRLDADSVTIKSFEERAQIGLGTLVWRVGAFTLAPHPSWQGRVVDALARPIDARGALAAGDTMFATDTAPPDPLRRDRVHRGLTTGIRVIDLFTPLCMGQRIGIFAGSGVGKSTLLGMLTRSQSFDLVVIALVGERGREVREFLDDNLGTALSRAVVVVATGDESPMMRRQAPRTAMTIAEYFRDRGANVLLIVDSITRYAHALREVALAAGEPPVARGYAPSVFTALQRLLERAGPGVEGRGSITGVFSVLVDGDDHNEPVADTVRGILDGHVVLDRAIAARGQYPAVDVLRSISRLAEKAWTSEQKTIAQRLKAMIAEYEDTRDLRMLGAYKPGANPELDRAVQLVPRVNAFLVQAVADPAGTDLFRALHKVLQPSA